MTNGIPAGGAPARLRPEDVIAAHDHLFAVWVRLQQLARQHDDEAAHILTEHDRLTVTQVVDAWRHVNRQLIEAVHRLEWIEQTIRSQRDGIVDALQQAADAERRELG